MPRQKAPGGAPAKKPRRLAWEALSQTAWGCCGDRLCLADLFRAHDVLAQLIGMLCLQGL